MAKNLKKIDTENKISEIRSQILEYINLMLSEAFVRPIDEAACRVAGINLVAPNGYYTNSEYYRKVASALGVSEGTARKVISGRDKPSMNFCMKVIGRWEAVTKTFKSEPQCNPNKLLALREALTAYESLKAYEVHSEAANAISKIGKKADRVKALEERVSTIEKELASLKKLEDKKPEEEDNE